jgi:hypothetical protein
VLKIFIPDGTTTGIVADITLISDATRCSIQWSNFFYEDGHKEGILWIKDIGYCVKEVGRVEYA